MAEARGKLSSHLQDDLLQINDVGVGVESPESLDLPQVVHLLNATCEEQTQDKVDTRHRGGESEDFGILSRVGAKWDFEEAITPLSISTKHKHDLSQPHFPQWHRLFYDSLRKVEPKLWG